MKILVCDALDEMGLNLLKGEEGVTVDVQTGIEYDSLMSVISGYDALIVRSQTRLDDALLSRSDRLKVIGRAGIGTDNIDIKSATRKGILVMNTPNENIITTAEHTIAMMLALSRRIPKASALLKRGLWEKKGLMGHQLHGKTIGIIGFGKIGAIVANRALVFKMKVLSFDPFIEKEQMESQNVQPVSLPELFSRSDYISLHLPHSDASHHLIDGKAFEQMKDGVMIINCEQGGLIDENDLLKAIRNGKVKGAALDVFEKEPPEMNPLFACDEVICTPHLGASTREAKRNVAKAICQQILDFLKNGSVVNALNMPQTSGIYLAKMAPHFRLGEEMGELTFQMMDGTIHAVELTLFGSFEKEDESFIIPSVLKGLMKERCHDRINSINAAAIADDFGIKIIHRSAPCEKEYLRLMELKAHSDQQTMTVQGTVIGPKASRIVRIDKFRLEMTLSGYMLLIHNIDCPGSIGQIASTLGEHAVNIEQMQVGQEEGGDRNIIFLSTDQPISQELLVKMRELSTVKSIRTLTF